MALALAVKGGDPPVKILTVAACPFPTRQGSQVLIRQAAEALAARGNEVIVASYAGGEDVPCSLPIARAPRLPGSDRLRAGPSLAKPLLDASLARTVSRLCAGWKPDVIHAHNVEGAAVALAVARSVPVVYHAHGLLSTELPAYLPASLRALAAGAGRLADRFLPRRAAATIALTDPAREAFLRAGADPASVFAIPPGIAVEEVDPRNAGLARARVCAPREALILYAGNADAYQSIDTLLDAVAALGADARDRVRLVFAIPGPPRDLPAQVVTRGLADRVVFLDASWEETARLLTACDAAVIPRADPYGFPMKLLNALALGAPVVTHPACAHGLTQGVDAILARGAAETAAALGKVIADPGWARRIGAAGRDVARKRHDWALVGGRIEAILAEAARPACARSRAPGQ